MIEINLLPPQNVLSQKEKILRRYLLMTAIGGGVGVVLALFMIFLGHNFFTIRSGILLRQRESLEAQVKDELETVKLLQTINDKIAGIKAIKKNQANFAVVLRRLVEIESLGAKVKGISLSVGNAVQFSASVPNSATLKIVLDNLSRKSTQDYFSKVVISGLQEEANGTLSFLVSATYHE